MPECTVHLIARQAGTPPSDFFKQLKLDIEDHRLPYIVKGKPCGWVHRPHTLQAEQLTGHDWDIFLLADYKELPSRVAGSVSAHVSVTVDIPDDQYDKLVAAIDQSPSVAPETPELPADWSPFKPGVRIDADPSGVIPEKTIVEAKDGSLDVGELRLDRRMADFLTNAEPRDIRGSPICYFNLFKYKNGDRSVHDSYMEGFKNKFGPAAGAQIKFMGPVQGQLKYEGEQGKATSDKEGKWDDANLVQYHSVWHYAYMLSTDVYKELNKEKVSGLDDTCILLVSELGV
ncbi:hypothetical protein HII31_08210 [Pseudocercospora fuligena]|uniref:Uncharacterized protein n=1 Tax=Pseudocercospora fuligena TaxID=685502 RepID=A0A8H6RG77_9PEZI|nr:hypothetical protein HII31_08210 [Pseudocercospora fuligena]